MDTPLRSSPRTSRWRWAGGTALACAIALLAVERHGLSSRVLFAPPPEFAGRRAAMVGSAADAYAVWDTAGVQGRRLVVLTGRWSRPRTLTEHPPTPEEMAQGPGDIIDPESAIFAAAQAGIVRRIDVVMPPPAFAVRLGEVARQKDLLRERGAFTLRFNGLERRFSTPEAFVPPREPALVLVEPSWFGGGTPDRPLEWLERAGVTVDLALVALVDPASADGQRAAAQAYGESLGLSYVEAPR